MKNKTIKVGIDFDGVLAYNPFRVARAPVVYIKRKLLGVKKTKFYIPTGGIEKFIWTLLHESSILPAIGTEMLRELVISNYIEAHLVTARYSFLQKSLYRWLERHDMKHLFTSITINEKDEQPHIYKARVIAEKKFDYFIEDNLDIVTHLGQVKSEKWKVKSGKRENRTKVLWIYNILDRRHPYEYKFPYLKKALEEIVLRNK